MKAPWQSSYPVTYPQYTIACNGWVLKRLLRLLTEPFKKLSSWKLIPVGKISTSVPSQSFKLGEFTIDWQGSDTKQPSLQIIHQSNSTKIIWQTSPGCSFVSGGDVRLTIIEERGSIEIDEQKHANFSDQIVEGIKQENDTLEIYGRLVGRQSSSDQPQYVLKLRTVGSKELDFQLQIIDGNVNETQLQFTTSPDEHFYGFGEQFSDIDCKGQWIPIVCEEGGIGRGDRGPRTLNLLGVAGNRFSSYAPVPYFFTNKGRAIFLTNTEPSIFNLRDPQIATIRVSSSCMQGRIFCGETPLDIIELYTNYVGRMPPLPHWLHQGAIVGMQGGTALVRQVWSKLRELDTPIAGFWLQDWVGQRRTIAGKQLWWNWQLDETAYPGWQQLVSDLAEAKIAVGVYVNPFLVDRPLKSNPQQRNLYTEALQQGFVVKKNQAEPYLIESTDFSAALLDLTNPDARKWFKNVLKEEVLGQGAKFWMADFAEAAPFEGVYAGDESGLVYHNQYPVDWVALNREAIQEAGKEGDAWFFNRAGFWQTPSHSTCMWLGDQNTTWGINDGIVSAVKGAISGGLSGFSINHSDIGGYTSIANPILEAIGIGFRRSRELLYRWMELNAFTPVFRTHEGNQPDKNVQFYTDEDSLKTFSYWAKVYAALAGYRQQLMIEAATKGYPIIRHLILHYPDDPNVYKLEEQFLLGSEFLVAPVLKPGKKTANVYFPAGEWVHLWSGNTYGNVTTGIKQTVPAPLGQPPVFYRQGSKVAQSVLEALKAKNIVIRNS
ncbi:alpha-glucosidase [Nostoc sp. CENA67]|uniref:Alpha-glucosidase n=1 Tax=Amazonocrinis nigriterrae CENA67 TaxID=2794033 RepID=A0A8J7L9S5_9NOST|nr:alpha-glucosidase [Amazonocrinis nigriterrae]MBH8561801.1 alpha-glucosidase [Amazonocrinis nigriterrae CENA67]